MHIGKISRLPKAVLDQLNQRLENNELTQPILAWLNDLPEVRQVLATLFDGVPISKMNLSRWRTGGFRHWQARQAALKMAPNILSESQGLQPSGSEPVTDQLAPWLAVHYLGTAKSLLGTNGVNDFKLLRRCCADLSSLRRGDHRSGQLKLDHER